MSSPVSAPGTAGPFLVVPSVEKGRGGGHLSRCAALVREARSLGREAFLFPCGPYTPGASPSPGTIETIPLPAGLDSAWITGNPAERAWDFIVLDRFQTPAGEYRFWSSRPLIGIDEGGPCRDSFDFLLDLLPGPPGRGRPNILDPGLLPLPLNRRPPEAETSGPLKVLISFGAEDQARLGQSCAAVLLSSSFRPKGGLHITLVDPQGTWAGEEQPPEKFRVLRGIPSLGEHLAEYDLLITHFGLSAFEALHAGVPVILVSPGPYHQRLARAAGFVSAGIGGAGARRLEKLLFRDLGDLRERCRSLARRHGLAGGGKRRFAELILSFRPQFLTRRCPCCGDSAKSALARFPRRSFYRCLRCGAVYQSRIDEPPIEYAREYFFEFYKKQYGKTYIEDFPNLISMAEKRLARIFPLLPGAPEKPEGARLLDIGCAYGAFLQAASRAGFDVLGLDPAEDAVRYVRDTLGLQARQGFFPPGEEVKGLSGPSAAGSFSAITLWYVIEHFRDPAGALEEGRRLLADGGVLAFSTPSFSGISGRTSRAFLEKSPEDHWTVWSPRTCRGILKRRGFAVRRIVVTGHHPERFPLLGRFCGGKKGPAYRFLFLLSRIFGLGDTFEVYAVKESRQKSS